MKKHNLLKYLMAGSIMAGIQTTNATDVIINDEFGEKTIAESQYANWTNVFVQTPLIISHPIVYETGMQLGVNILIGDSAGAKASNLIIRPTSSVDYLLSTVRFDTIDSTLTLDSTSAGGNITFQHYFPGIGGFLYDNSFWTTTKQDKAGSLELLALDGNDITLKVNDYTTGPIGADANHRINIVRFIGDSKITVEPPVYAFEMIFNTSAPIYLNSGGNAGDNGKIILQTNTDLHLGAPLIINNPYLEFGSRHLTIHDNALALSGEGKLEVAFSGNNGIIGCISSDNVGSVDGSSLTKLDVGFTVDLTDEHLLAANEKEYELKVFDDNVLNPGLNVNLSPASNNAFITWTFDNTKGTINSTTNWEGLQEAINEMQQSEEGEEVGKAEGGGEVGKAEGGGEVGKAEGGGEVGKAEGGGEVSKDELKEVIQIVNEVTSTAIAFVKSTNNNTEDNNLELTQESKEAGIRATAFIQALGEAATSKAELKETLLTLKNTIQTIQEDGANEEITGELSDKAVGFATSNVNFGVPSPSSPQVNTTTTNINGITAVSPDDNLASNNLASNNLGGSPASGTATGGVNTGNTTSAGNSASGSGNNNAGVTGGGSSVSSGTTGDNNQNLTGPGDIQQQSQQQDAAAAADASLLGYGVAAGDDLTSKYGIWFSPFYQKAIQKKIKTDNGYKVANMGGTIGIDCKANEITSLGFAWSNIKSILNQTDGKAGSKGITRSNFFSLYGTYELPKNFFLSAVGSYGISNIKNIDKRKITSKKSQYAVASYKTQIYSGQLMLGKNIPLKRNFMLTPLAGIKYTEFHDDAYKERGTSFLNYKLTKKRYSYLDGILGTKLSYDTLYNGYKMTPHLSAMAHINLKDNPSTSYLTGDAFLNPIQLKGEKRDQKAWYTIGAGLDFSKDNMEYAISYENQIDKKYVGHMAKLKIKVNL